MILIGLGSNLESKEAGEPQSTLEAALAALQAAGIGIAARSSWYRSEPVPRSAQPWFVNGVAALETGLEPQALLRLTQAIEARFGRVRSTPNAPRSLDLDLLDCDGLVLRTPSLTLPHPQLHLRRFVLLPLAEVAPGWRHPVLRENAAEMLARVVDDYRVERIAAP